MLTPNELLNLITQKSKYLNWEESSHYDYTIEDLVNSAYLELHHLVGTELTLESISRIESVIKNLAIRRGRDKVTTVSYPVELPDSQPDVDPQVTHYQSRLYHLLDRMGANQLLIDLVPRIKEV